MVVSDRLEDNADKGTKYPVEKVVLCATLNKLEVWAY